MNILAQELGKKFQNDWIFRHFNFTFEQPKSYAITGPNGSGKSTLLKILSGMMPATEGKLIYSNEDPLPEESYYSHLVIAAPYLELIEEFTLDEFLRFHFKFKPMLPGKTIEDLLDFSYLQDSKNKRIRNFSSGMKQRLKLTLCFYSDVPVALLDEPTTNLDKKGIAWYHEHANILLKNRLTLLCSNRESEYSECDFRLDMQDFK
jgi:ABC-type multidrug transport system ATPase subunit